MRLRSSLNLTVLILVLCAFGADAYAQLPERVNKVAKNLGVPVENISVWVQAIGSNEVILEHQPDKPRTPASTLKLVPTFAALQALTPAYRWRTEVYANGSVAGGVLYGDLLIRGYGDPFLVAEEYWKLVGEVRNAGIRKITGELVFDGSFFELPEEDPGAFDNQPDRVYNLVPHALLVNFTAARFQFTPNGKKVTVRVEPELEHLRVANSLTTVDKSCSGYQRGIAIRVRDHNAKRDRVALDGKFPDRCRSYALTRTVMSPEAYAFDLFNKYWKQYGGEPIGRYRIDTIPASVAELDEKTARPKKVKGRSQIYVHLSRPLGDMVRLVNKWSNNVMTRHLQLTVGAEVLGGPATPGKGEEAVLAVLKEHGVPTTGLILDNPSGLSRDARISARQMGTLLINAWDAPYMPEFVSSLAISGIDGTARRRFNGKAGAGRMHLKTGTMDHVSSIAGYVQAVDGQRYVVAVLINTPNAHRGLGKEIQDAMLTWLYKRRASN